jgi:hypothetical protein
MENVNYIFNFINNQLIELNYMISKKEIDTKIKNWLSNMSNNEKYILNKISKFVEYSTIEHLILYNYNIIYKDWFVVIWFSNKLYIYFEKEDQMIELINWWSWYINMIDITKYPENIFDKFWELLISIKITKDDKIDISYINDKIILEDLERVLIKEFRYYNNWNSSDERWYWYIWKLNNNTILINSNMYLPDWYYESSKYSYNNKEYEIYTSLRPFSAWNHPATVDTYYVDIDTWKMYCKVDGRLHLQFSYH